MDKVQLFLLENGKKFKAVDAEIIRQRLMTADDDTLYRVSALELRDPMLIFVISFFAGTLGIDRFMIGQTGLGVAKLLTCGGLFVWALVDLFLIMDATKKVNFEKIQPYLGK
jgi:TM2 domain-containing membrane protein YozV